MHGHRNCAFCSKGPLAGRFPGVRRDIQAPNDFGAHGTCAIFVVPCRAAEGLARAQPDADGAGPVSAIGLVYLDRRDVTWPDRVRRWLAVQRNPLDTELAMSNDPERTGVPVGVAVECKGRDQAER